MTLLRQKPHHGCGTVYARRARVPPTPPRDPRAALSSASAIGTIHMTPMRGIILAHWHTRMDPP